MIDGIEQKAALKKLLLIDLENCPNHIQELQDSLRYYDKVIICYASTGARIPLDWLMALHDTINAGRLQIHKMDSIGKNAADFGIFFFAGMLAQQLSEPAEFVIVSDDADLEHLVGLLSAQGHVVRRDGKDKPQVKQEAKASQPKQNGALTAAVMQGMQSYCQMLHQYVRTRPSKEQSLKNSLHAHLGQQTELSKQVLEQLIAHKALSLDGSKVVYQPSKIAQLARLPS